MTKHKDAVVCLYIKSDSLNENLIFKNKTIKEIKESLWKNQNFYSAKVHFTTIDCQENFINKLKIMLDDFYREFCNFQHNSH